MGSSTKASNCDNGNLSTSNYSSNDLKNCSSSNDSTNDNWCENNLLNKKNYEELARDMNMKINRNNIELEEDDMTRKKIKNYLQEFNFDEFLNVFDLAHTPDDVLDRFDIDDDENNIGYEYIQVQNHDIMSNVDESDFSDLFMRKDMSD